MTDGVGPLSLSFPHGEHLLWKSMLRLFVFFHSTLLLKRAKKVLDTSSPSLAAKLTSKEPMIKNSNPWSSYGQDMYC